MSGWIKMGVGLRRHPKVVRLASALKADRLRVVGALHAVWCVFDEHSNDGRLYGYSSAIMDEEIGWRGFSKAMQGIGWLVEAEDSLTVPDYEEHNGPTARRRATETVRKAVSREAAGDVRTGTERIADHKRAKRGQVSASNADTLRAREEKRREEEKTMVAPASADPTPPPTPPLKAKDLIAEGVEAQTAADWLALRKAKRLPLTQTAWVDTKAEGTKAGLTAPQTVAKAVANNWAGFKAAWLARDAAKAQNGADVFDGVH